MLTVSWELPLGADGYAVNTVKAYQNAVRSLADWLAEHHPKVGPGGADLRALLATCAGTDFTARRDASIIMLFLDGGLRLSELAGLQVAESTCGTGSCSWPARRAGAVAPGIGRSRSGSRRPGRWIATCASDVGTHTRTRRGSGWAAAAARP